MKKKLFALLLSLILVMSLLPGIAAAAEVEESVSTACTCGSGGACNGNCKECEEECTCTDDNTNCPCPTPEPTQSTEPAQPSESPECSCNSCKGDDTCECEGNSCKGEDACECDGCKPDTTNPDNPGGGGNGDNEDDDPPECNCEGEDGECKCGDDCISKEDGECSCPACSGSGDDNNDNPSVSPDPSPSESPDPSPSVSPDDDDDYYYEDDDDDDDVPTPTTPVGSGNTTTPATDAGSGTTTATTTATSTTSGTTASSTVSSTAMENSVSSAVSEAAKQGTAPVVKVEVSTSARATSLEVNLPAASLETLAAAEGASLVISSNIAEVTLDHTALGALADKATGSTVTLEVAPVETAALNEAQQAAVSEAAVTVMDLSLVSDGEAVHDYNDGTITISLPYTPPAGVSVNKVGVFYLADNGALSVCKSSFKGGKMTFTTNHLSMYVMGDASLALSLFKDVAKDAYYADAVGWAAVRSVTDGLEDAAFGPATSVTRGQAMTFLWRAANEPAAKGAQDMFDDVPANEYYTKAVAWAVENGITDGYSDTEFAPGLPVTNAQMLTFLARAMGATVPGDDWQLTTAKWAVEQNLFEGLPAVPENDEGCPRSDVVYFLYLVCGE